MKKNIFCTIPFWVLLVTLSFNMGVCYSSCSKFLTKNYHYITVDPSPSRGPVKIVGGLTVGGGNWEVYTRPSTWSTGNGLEIQGDLIINDGTLEIDADQFDVDGNIYVNSCGSLIVKNSDGGPTFFYFNGSHFYVMPGGSVKIDGAYLMMNTESAIAIESNYIRFSGDAAPTRAGRFEFSNGQILPGTSDGWKGISVSGGNGQRVLGTYFDGLVSNSQYFSQNTIPFTKDIYVGQLIITNSAVEGMTQGIANYDKYSEPGFLGHYGDPLGSCSGGGLIQSGNTVYYSNGNNVFSFYDYTNWMPLYSTNITYASANKLIKDKSFIRKAWFHNLLPMSTAFPTTSRYIFTYRTDGVSIQGCLFECSSTHPGANIAAIESNESNISVTSACNDPYIHVPVYGCSSKVKTEIQDLPKFGIEITHSLGSYIAGNEIGYIGINGVGVDMHECMHDVIINNNIVASIVVV